MSDEKKPTVTGEVMRQGGGALTGGVVGAVVAAPVITWGLGVMLAPFTGGLSVAAAAAVTAAATIGGAVMGHKMAKKVDD